MVRQTLYAPVFDPLVDHSGSYASMMLPQRRPAFLSTGRPVLDIMRLFYVQDERHDATRRILATRLGRRLWRQHDIRPKYEERN